MICDMKNIFNMFNEQKEVGIKKLFLMKSGITNNIMNFALKTTGYISMPRQSF